MININGTDYNFCLIDTCVISELLKNPKRERENFINIFLGSHYIPCISLWSILEIRQKNDLFTKFLDFFSLFPFSLTKSSIDIFNNEIEVYPNYKEINPILTSFSFFNKDKDLHLKPFFEKLERKSSLREYEQKWNSFWKKDALDSIINLKKNFSPSGNRYKSIDGLRFVSDALPQYVYIHAPKWSKKMIAKGEEPNPNCFPSIKMALYTVFFRFYAESREPQIQDVFDISINNIVPYLDLVVTEKFQAEIFRKIQRIDNFISHIDIHTINYLR